MQILNLNYTLPKYNKFTLSPSKALAFSGDRLKNDNTTNTLFETNTPTSYINPFIEKREDLSIEEQKKFLEKTILNNKTFQQNPKIKEDALTIINYSKIPQQLMLLDFVINNDYFYTENEMQKMRGIIPSAKSARKCSFVQKILSNEAFYKNKNVVDKLESILYTFGNNSYTYTPKFDILDMLLTSRKLYQNNKFMDSVGSILYHAEDFVSSYKTINIIDSILANKKLINDENFIQVVGKTFALRDVARYSNLKFPDILNELGENKKQIYIVDSIARTLLCEGTDILSKVIKDEKLSDDEDFLKYLPDIMMTINSKTSKKADTLIKYIDKNKTKNSEKFNKELISEYMYGPYDSILKAEQLVKVKLEAFDKKYQLKSALLELSDKNINNFFDDNKKQILTALEILGEATFVHAYNLKMTGLKDLCEKCEIIKENSNADYYEKLLLQTNPSASKKYLNLQQNILELKRNYVEVKNSGNTSDLKRLQDEINTFTTESMNVLAQKIPYDPDTTIRKIKLTAEIACEFDENPTKSNHYKLIDLMKNPSVENEKKEREIVCKTIFDKLEMEYDEKLAEKIDLVNWRYLREILSANSTFLDNLKKIFEEIQNNPDKQISEIFNELEHNKETKRYFDRLHIDYDKWVNFDENSYVIIGNKYSSINVGNKSLEVLENILNSDNFINLSQSYKTDILKQLKESGYLEQNKKTKEIKLIANSASEIKNIYRIIRNQLNNDLWTTNSSDKKLNLMKDEVYQNFVDSFAMIRALLFKKTSFDNIIVQKVNMNNLGKALFIGNDASCCMAVGSGHRQGWAPNYASNKFINVIEVLDSNIPVGNTTCYFAFVDGDLSLILDNIHLKPEYKNRADIKNGILEYAKHLCKEVGKPNIPIYIGGHRNGVVSNYSHSDNYKIQIVGNSGSDFVYFDFQDGTLRVHQNESHLAELTRLE